MYKRLISFGDSFVWGSELQDCVVHLSIDIANSPNVYPNEYKIIKERKIGPFSELDIHGRMATRERGHSFNTWPALVAEQLGLDYYCHARPGSSNQTIARTLMKFITDINSDDLIIINWTFCDRWDYVDTNEIFVDKQWKTLRPSSKNKTKIEKFYFEAVQSELWNKWESLRAIMLAKYLLESRNIRYFMTCEDELIFDNKFHCPSYIANAQQEVLDNIVWFEGKGFYHWAKEKNFPRGKENDHPLEEAHRAAFDYINDKITL